MIETILVLLVVIVLIVSGLILYFKFYSQSLKETGEELVIQGSSIMLESVVAMPEIQCSSLGLKQGSCVDTLKLYVLKEKLDEEKNPDYSLYMNHYAGIFGWRTIKFVQLYPVPEVSQECEIEDYQNVDYLKNCNSWTIYHNPKSNFRSNRSVSTPVSLYFPNLEIYTIGRLYIQVYS